MMEDLEHLIVMVHGGYETRHGDTRQHGPRCWSLAGSRDAMMAARGMSFLGGEDMSPVPIGMSKGLWLWQGTVEARDPEPPVWGKSQWRRLTSKEVLLFSRGADPFILHEEDIWDLFDALDGCLAKHWRRLLHADAAVAAVKAGALGELGSTLDDLDATLDKEGVR